MEHESMVHALNEIRRVIKPKGVLIDLRPVEDNWTVEVVTSAGFQVGGRLNGTPQGLADDEAAFNAMKQAESNGWFIREKEEEFSYFYYWDTPSESKEFMDTEWEDFIKMDNDIYQKTAALWATANADAQVRVRVRILISKWEKSMIVNSP